MRNRRFIFLAAAMILAAIPASRAYVLEGPKWAVNPVPYYINPVNNDVTQDAAIAAIQTGASAWSMQTNANTSLYYMGPTSGTTLQNNGKNEIFFRNTSNGGVIAETYWWADANNHMVDADVVLYDGGFTFFTGTLGCLSGVYIEDTMTHEFGHVLGMAHSAVTTATMYPTMSWCSTDWRTLDPDDQSGIEALYGTVSANTPPTVTITSPAANSSFQQGTSVTMMGSATDKQDGTISSRISWSSSLDGALGTGSSVAWTPSAGTQVVTAQVTDNNGATTSTQESIVVTAVNIQPPAPPSAIALTAIGTKIKGLQRVSLTWAGATSSNVDVYRNNALIMTTANDGSQLDAINKKGSGTYNYKVCESGTATCSNVVTVVF
ncbi:MAG TPA: matrixin family metalloprotease [Vicinamibacterales bacterium]|nr:matrixin family metalloprotease [Vicinamibacterales bacterium]